MPSADRNHDSRGASTRRRRGRWAVSVVGPGAAAGLFATDLSVVGLFLEGVPPRPIGSRLAIVISLPGGDVATGAVVRWTRNIRINAALPQGSGLEFDPLSRDDHARVVAALEAAPSETAAPDAPPWVP